MLLMNNQLTAGTLLQYNKNDLYRILQEVEYQKAQLANLEICILKPKCSVITMLRDLPRPFSKN